MKKKVKVPSVSFGENNPSNKGHHEEVICSLSSKTAESLYPWIFIVSTQAKRAKTWQAEMIQQLESTSCSSRGLKICSQYSHQGAHKSF